MDFLSRRFAYGSLVVALCLGFSPSAFAVLDSPIYSWRLSSSGNVYRVYDPQGGRASSVFTPSSTFAEGSSGGVIETFDPLPLTIDGATGDVIAGLSRSLTVGDLVGGLTDAMSGPLGAAIIGASNLLPFLDAIYNQYEANLNSAEYPPVSSSNPFFSGGCDVDGFTSSTPVGAANAWLGPGVTSYATCNSSDVCDVYTSNGGLETILQCGGTASYTAPSGYGVSSSPPSNIVPWVVNNWTSDGLASDASTVLNNNPSYSPLLSDQLASNDAPLSSPVPYVYNPTSNGLSSPPSTSTSTDPSTGNSTVTTTTPSYKVTPGTNGGLNVNETSKVVTQSCTSAGSCTVINTTTTSSTPKSTPFVAPTLSNPSAPTASVTDVPLSLVMPSQSNAVCPAPLSYTALGNNFTIPLTPLCNLATDARPYLESLGAVGAGIVIFH
ncbi:hypothetical protein HF283_20700 [Acidithiobacillus ferrooxidans]|nr:hypothetical protein [Acidithiobacillus ferridurans]MBU2826486.1 hypothetical protein [Acidithiobacillus ferrooxidans]